MVQNRQLFLSCQMEKGVIFDIMACQGLLKDQISFPLFVVNELCKCLDSNKSMQFSFQMYSAKKLGVC